MLWPEALALIRRSRNLALASLSAQMPGYPHVSWLPMVADEAGRPMLVMSRLAEHTQNILQDSKVSVLLHDDEMALNKARLTILGDLQLVEPDPLLAARMARYNPELVSYLQMSDFSVWRLWPQRARYIAGFGKMGWLEGERWESEFALSLAQEAQLLSQYAPMTALELVGVDVAGCDIRRGDVLQRHEFAAVCRQMDQVAVSLEHITRNLEA
ncbi:pyridoxamine 5'-phosphate oxidase family protein [Chitinibacter bivalviorum]|uniref:Pyridoxamine 5'-phosphate oxidase family protein n=1 Tax=Chitinibacter bivalviorum TaxID=2739434 RepID=A0A7H9BQH3_9NEIS|nr:pyridoxamine 5'-phosphate oxidase family protein [Chitinibacter bivalviorum]QLG89494.1 pyridoxamine 5'-phosphate oxidase family protein [Chitinibacter bivalviorum]